MELDVTRDRDTSSISATGDLDLSSTDALLNAARAALAGTSEGPLALDLSGVRFIDSSGISALIEIRDLAAQAGVALKLVAPSPRVLEVLRLTAVDSLFDIAHV